MYEKDKVFQSQYLKIKYFNQYLGHNKVYYSRKKRQVLLSNIMSKYKILK